MNKVLDSWSLTNDSDVFSVIYLFFFLVWMWSKIVKWMQELKLTDHWIGRTVQVISAAQAADWTHWWHWVFIANAQLYELFFDLIAFHGWILFANFQNFRLNFGCCVAWLRTANDTWTEWASLLVTIQDLWDATMRDPQLAWNVAWSGSLRGHFNDFQAQMIWQWSAIDENTTKLVNSSLT